MPLQTTHSLATIDFVIDRFVVNVVFVGAFAYRFCIDVSVRNGISPKGSAAIGFYHYHYH